MKYKADLGSWTDGRCVEFEAADHDAAVKKAGDLIDDSYPPEAIVVQVKVKTSDGWSCVFDYMNGMSY